MKQQPPAESNQTNTSKQPRNLRKEGNTAEALAARFLEEHGYAIIQRNFHFGRQGEIDIIAEVATPLAPAQISPAQLALAQKTSTEIQVHLPTEQTLVFVEVKARNTATYGTPESAVTASKQRKLRRAAEGYMHVHKRYDQPCRFDVVAIELFTDPPTIRHIVNAF